MIIAEILSYRADIICLQEVDASIHDSLINPVLSANGYEGFYSNKVTSQQEGCSMFWSTSVFEMARAEDMNEFPLRSLLNKDASLDESEYYNAKSTVRDLVELERWESMDGIRQLLEAHDEVRRVYSDSVGQILQVVRLSPKSSEQSSEQSSASKPDSIVVANTHLFYHPMAGHIRLLQAFAVCHKLDQIRRMNTENPAPLLICGDFNSDPLSGEFDLLSVSSWSFCTLFASNTTHDVINLKVL
jgi:mRNA deadenylase 3'-5' endonuclease subunit Ccr4